MTWKGIVQDAVIIGVMFTGFIIIHKNALKQETTKITNHIDQKFKRVDGDINAVPSITAPINNVDTDSCVAWKSLSNRERRRLKRKLHNN